MRDDEVEGKRKKKNESNALHYTTPATCHDRSKTE